MPFLFASAILLTIIKSAMHINQLETSSLNNHLPQGDENLHNRILQAERDKKLYIHQNNEIVLALPYTEATFRSELNRILDIYFKDSDEISNITIEALKRSSDLPPISGMFELHRIEHEDVNVKISSLLFSPIKQDKVWNFYLFTWGTPYVDIHLSQKNIILL